MTTIESRLRRHIDAIAPPVEPDTVVDGSAPNGGPGRDRTRWPLRVAATTLLVAGLAATVALLVDRPASAPVAGPPSTTPSADTTAATTMSTAPVATIRFMVDAGDTVEQIGEQLADSVDTIGAADFGRSVEQAASESDFVVDGTSSPEGLLAPGTYDIAPDASATDVVTQMVHRMNAIGEQSDIATRGAALGRSPYEILIIASMIEQEALVAGDRARISRVIHNRLFVTANDPEEPFSLQIDSAVLYGRSQEDIDPDLPFSQLRTIPTDWNTYLLPGLPRTPIAVPSRESIEAALEPAPNPTPDDPICRDLSEPKDCFLFFYVIAEEDGAMAFAATAEQHESNVERARLLGVI